MVLSCRSDTKFKFSIYSDLSPSSVLFEEGGDVTKRVNARDENEINNTGFGVNRYRCVHQY